jgi:hypothetical protein
MCWYGRQFDAGTALLPTLTFAGTGAITVDVSGVQMLRFDNELDGQPVMETRDFYMTET